MSKLMPRDMMEPDAPVDEVLFAAVREKDHDTLRAHLAAGNAPDQTDAENNTPLFLALQANDPVAVRILLDAGADVAERSPYSVDSALRLALQNQCKESVRLLLEHGADPGFCSVGEGFQGKKREVAVPDFVVAQEGDPEIAAMVDAAYQKFRAVYAVSGRHEPQGGSADYRCDPDTVRKLLQDGVPVDIKDCRERTALMYAVTDRDIPMVKMLLEEFHADPEVMTEGEYTALCLAVSCQETNPALVKLLVDNGANPHHVFSDGKTMMHHAATSNNPEILKMLVAMGVPLNAVSNDGQTPTDAGIEYGHKNLAPVVEGVKEWWKEQVVDISQRATRLENDVKPLRPLSLRAAPKA
ncbi:MAG: ankyrin repeat domain-containing protein [Alphaproteobacteria bacterium]